MFVLSGTSKEGTVYKETNTINKKRQEEVVRSSLSSLIKFLNGHSAPKQWRNINGLIYTKRWLYFLCHLIQCSLCIFFGKIMSELKMFIKPSVEIRHCMEYDILLCLCSLCVRSLVKIKAFRSVHSFPSDLLTPHSRLYH